MEFEILVASKKASAGPHSQLQKLCAARVRWAVCFRRGSGRSAKPNSRFVSGGGHLSKQAIRPKVSTFPYPSRGARDQSSMANFDADFAEP